MVDFEAVTGRGVRGVVSGEALLLGSPLWMSEQGVVLAPLEADLRRLEDEANTVVVLARAKGPKLLGALGIADALKPTATGAVKTLTSMGIEAAMVTGDNPRTAQAIATQAGISLVFAQVLPADKAGRVAELQKQGKLVAFVGDGINDAPALAQADVGIAMGTGTDIAIDTAGVVLVKGDPLKAAWALGLARRTWAVICQNLFWAFFYNLAALPLAAMGQLNPMIAAGAMALSSVSVVSNSLRLRGVR